MATYELFSAMSDATQKPVRNPSDAARVLYQALPGLIDGITNHDNTARLMKQTGVFNQDMLSNVIKSMTWVHDNYDVDKALTFCFNFLPSLISISDLSRNAIDKTAFTSSLVGISNMVASGTVEIFSPLCPPYTYTVNNGRLKHVSGELQPTVGDRFEMSMSSLNWAFSDLTKLGIQVNMNLVTYSGEYGQDHPEYLVEMGDDVLFFYRDRESDLYFALGRAYQDLESSCRDVSRDRFNVFCSSIEEKYSPQIISLIDSFLAEFSVKTTKGPQIKGAENDLEKWLKLNIGVDSGWLEFYLEQQADYSELQGFAMSRYSTLLAALREGLLYNFLIADSNSSVLLDFETTSNYIRGGLYHLDGNVIMMREYDPDNPNNHFNIRQPFNSPR